MSPRRARRSRSRQTTPQSPPKSIPTRASPRLTRHNASSKQPAQVQSSKLLLPALEEDDDDGVESESEIEVNPANVPSPSPSLSPSLSPRVQSESGGEQDEFDESPSDVDSDGATQLEALDIDLICDSLPPLYYDASQILSLFHSGNILDVVHDIHDLPSKTAKRFQNFVSRFNASREAYGENSYINIQLILRKVTGDSELNQGLWRPDAVLQLANLARFIQDISSDDENVIYDTLERMFHTFPEPFINSPADAQDTHLATELLKEIVFFGLALRTQFFIQCVARRKNDPAFDPDLILHQVFVDEHGGLDGSQLEMEHVPAHVDEDTKNRMESIRTTFKKSSKDPIDLPQLRRKYSRQDFLTQASRWTSLCRKELDRQIKAQGGVDVIQRKLEQKDFTTFPPSAASAADVRENESFVLHQTPKQQNTSSLLDRSAVARRAERLRAIQARNDQGGSEVSEESDDRSRDMLPPKPPLESPAAGHKPTVAEIPQTPEAAVTDQINDDSVGIGDEYDEEVEPEVASLPVRTESPPRPTQSSIVPTQKTLAVLQVAQQQALIGNKENIDTTRRGYSDRQPNARRLQWDDSQSRRKRPRAESVEDVIDEDDDFETDARPQKRSRIQRPQPAHAVDDWLESNPEDDVIVDEADKDDERNSRKDTGRFATSIPPSAQPPPPRSTHSSQNRNTSAPRHSQRPTPNSPRPSDNRDEDIPPATQHIQVNREARATMLKVAMHAGPRIKPPQSRRAWTPDEINRLFDLMADCGCAWASILVADREHPDGPRLQQRTQVQLKDKARNLKMDYLKSGNELPLGFANVTIKSADKELLTSMSLPYELKKD